MKSSQGTLDQAAARYIYVSKNTISFVAPFLFRIMGKLLLAQLLMIFLSVEVSLCVEVDYGGRPQRPVEVEGKFSNSKFSNIQIFKSLYLFRKNKCSEFVT